MDKKNSHPLTPQELFENTLWYFYLAVKELSKPAASQCEKVPDSISIAWEIKDDFLRDCGLHRLPHSYLSQEQIVGIEHLAETLESVPESVFESSRTNLQAMQHPCWSPIRKEAEQLLALLEPAHERNKIYFKVS